MKNIVKIIVGILMTVGGVVLIRTVGEPEGILHALPYICIGLGCGIFGQGLGDLLARKAYRKYPELERQLEIERLDERNVMIGDRAKARAYDLMIYVYAALMLAFALMGESLWVVIPLVIAYLFVQGYAIYQRVRLEKEE